VTGPSGVGALVQQLRAWIENRKINTILLERGVFRSAIELGKLHDDLDQYNPRGLAMITQRLLSNRFVRRRILALAPDRKTGREAMDALRTWADVASGIDPQAKGN
jgi:hypothetical protein